MKSPEKRGHIDRHGYNVGKRIKDKKRHVLNDTEKPLMPAIVHVADIQDRDGNVQLVSTPFEFYPLLRKISADSDYQGSIFERGAT